MTRWSRVHAKRHYESNDAVDFAGGKTLLETAERLAQRHIVFGIADATDEVRHYRSLDEAFESTRPDSRRPLPRNRPLWPMTVTHPISTFVRSRAHRITGGTMPATMGEVLVAEWVNAVLGRGIVFALLDMIMCTSVAAEIGRKPPKARFSDGRCVRSGIKKVD